METPLTGSYLKTKLLHPQARSQLVPRGRLLRRMDEVLQVPLTLVCAPAGYGKTTLLVEWVHACPVPAAWLTLSQEESDIARFMGYFILALQLLDPQLGKSAQAVLNAPGTVDMFEIGLPLLLNDLAELESPLVVVLDDYHWIDSPDVHAALAYLVEHWPPHLHLVIASRVEPPINLTRLRARGFVLELRTADLSFQPDEIAAFLNGVMALGLSAEECSLLEQQTEGWAAGLQLAGLSLRSGERAAGSPESLAPAISNAGQHYIFEYLAEEVLRRQPPDLQRFLLHTSILDQLSGSLCEALVEPFVTSQDGAGFPSGASCLDYLEHANLFTQALDGEHYWYRYHALFADFLRGRLHQTDPAIVPELHRRAAHWLTEHGAFDEAYKHALAGNDLEQAAELVERCANGLEVRGELITLSRLIAALPEDLVRARPRLSLARAWVAIGRLDFALVESCLDQAEQTLTGEAESALRGEIMAARALAAGLQYQADASLAYTEQALRLLPGEQHYLHSLLKFSACFPQMLSGQIVEAVHDLDDAVCSALQSNSPFIALLALRIQGEGCIHLGRLSQAERIFHQIIDLVEKELGKHSPLVCVAWPGLGEVCRQRNDFPQAFKYLEDGIEMTLTWMPAFATDGLMWLSSLKQAAGDPAGAQAAVQRAHQISELRDHAMLDDWWVPIVAVKLNIVQGYLEEAVRWARSTGLEMETLGNLDEFFADQPAYYRESAFYVLARLYLVLGRRERVPGALEHARTVLLRILPDSEDQGHYAFFLEGLILLAQVEQAAGQIENAQELIHRALDLGAPERLMRAFLDEGEYLMKLLVERRALDLPAVERAYLEELLMAWDRQQGLPLASQPVVQPGLIDPLSFRELEVLRWIADGKSNQEIAAGLVVSLNTVKKHVSTIMNKLGAKNRTQAVLLARQLNLLDAEYN